VLLNNAGVSGAGAPGPISGAAQRFDDVSADIMVDTFRINAVAPLLVTRALIDNVAASERKVVAMQSSQMGSIDDASGGYYAYRASKTALNMIAKALSEDLRSRGVIILALHPGWVRTDMGGGSAPVEADASAKGQQDLFDRATLRESGRFWVYDGRELPW
jgi:NAD(P)-dependent dehydrogenase (short-subunit alcohol dehydrogenase family)